MGAQTIQVNPSRQKQQQQQIEEETPPTKLSHSQCFFYLGDTQNGKKILEIFEGVHYSIFITVVTLITLFADDFRVIFFTGGADQGFSILTIICMAIFFIEIVVLSMFKENYFFGLYFWLDMVSTFTMILDLVWITQLMNGNGGVQTAASLAKVARASRASKIGAKATKLIRIIRLIRFLKLYKTASRQLAKQSNKQQKVHRKIQINQVSRQSKFSAGMIQHQSHAPNKRWSKIQNSSHKMIGNHDSGQLVSLMNFHGFHGSKDNIAMGQKDQIIQSIKKIQTLARKRHTQNIKDLAGFQSLMRDFHTSGSKAQPSQNNIANSSGQIQVPNETRVGTKVKDQIQKNMIIMILLIIITIPLFNASTWYTNLTSYELGIRELENAATSSSKLFDSIDNHFIDFMQSLPSRLIYFQVPINTTCCTFPDDYAGYSDKYKIMDSTEYRTEDLLSYTTDSGSVVVFQQTATAILTSQLNIGRTLFVCIVLIVSTLLFSRDVQIYALEPLQNMFDTVKKIAQNPLNAIRQIQQKNMCIQSFEQELNQTKQEQTQPNMLQNLIVKIGGLLAVGFGQAGTQIISNVIQDPNFVNVIIPGQKVMGIYGFCDIRNFTDATEILEADVMVFVNEIAGICHRIVNGHCGSPNKNIGDAFLLVWKYKESDTTFQQQEGHSKKLHLAQTKRVKQIADLAVLSFVRMIAEIAKSYTLLKYKNNKGLKNRIKDYKGVKMGFGLHVGWSIQGPIGSQYKVDASYLSPDVNMSSRLQAGTKQYGVPMLITQQVYKLMTQNKHYLRKIDRVLFDGRVQPTDLYTVDLHIDSLINHVSVHKQKELTPKQRKYKKIRQNIKRNKLLQDIQIKYVTKQMWQDNDIRILRQRYSHSFYQEWQKGFESYIKGQWKQALQTFKRTQLMAPDQMDGPSRTLISFIESYNGEAPMDWKGYRQATF